MEIVGIQKEGQFVKAACLKRVGREIVIQSLETDYSPGKGGVSVTGIQGPDLLIRRLSTPLKTQKSLLKTLPFQLEPLIPYSLEEVVIKPIFEKKEGETEILCLTVSKKALQSHLADMQEIGIDPDWVSAHSVALWRFARFTCPSIPSLLVFHVGRKGMELVSVKEGQIQSHVPLHIGIDDFEDSQVAARFQKEVDRALCFLSHKEDQVSEREVLFCGEKIPNLTALLKGCKDCRVTPIKVDGHRGFNGESILPFAIPIGLSLDVLEHDGSSIQLRQEEFVNPKAIRQVKRKIGVGALLSVCFLSLGFLFSQLYFKKVMDGLSEQLDQIVRSEKGMLVLDIKNEGDFDRKVKKINEALSRQKRSGRIWESPPKASDLLLFLSNNTTLGEMDIKQVIYELKESPSLQNVNGVYKPWARVVFGVAEAKKAREFHDFIVDNEAFIDQSEPIEWNRNNDEYEISFYFRA